MHYIAIFLVIGAFSWLLFNFFKYGGIKQAMFRGKILRTVGSIACSRGWSSKKGIFKGELRVHTIEPESNKGKREVGFEIVYKSPLSYQMTPITLSSEEARSLIQLIEEALHT